MRGLPVLLIGLIGLAACQPKSDPGYTDDPHEGYVDPGPDEIARAVERRAGEAIDAADQPVSLWTQRIWADEDAPWLYVAEAGAPSREHIIRVTFDNGGYPVEVYRIPASALPADTTSDDLFVNLSPSDLELATGCTIWMDRTGPNEYAGRTDGADCTSPKAETAYETLDIEISDHALRWSRRGFDANSSQVWGSTPAR